MHNHSCLYVYSAKCIGQRLQVSQCMEIFPNISLHRHGNDTTVSASTSKKSDMNGSLTLASYDSGSLATL